MQRECDGSMFTVVYNIEGTCVRTFSSQIINASHSEVINFSPWTNSPNRFPAYDYLYLRITNLVALHLRQRIAMHDMTSPINLKYWDKREELFPLKRGKLNAKHVALFECRKVFSFYLFPWQCLDS